MTSLNKTVLHKACACKGIRSCLLCEHVSEKKSESFQTVETFYYCILCADKAWTIRNHEQHTPENKCLTINGVFVASDVISEEEENEIVQQIDSSPSSQWVLSQSGRRKQDFGPKVNFKKKICKIGSFSGIPRYAQSLMKKIREEYSSVMRDFEPVELCNLEYVPERGSSIDPHLDDTWIWGERLVTLNLLSETSLTLTPVEEAIDSSRVSITEIVVVMPARSLLVLSSDARYRWFHAIKREHITARRIAMTWRELPPNFLPDGEEYESLGKQLLELAKNEI
ncbi:alpha-ketoglutarate-dependent dioxygenase alkB 4-like protein [Dinothrombium tinctorium]|uniref:Alpha-ketoglutarate-dependent dioxygenase alkB 4-like protein n=1 Tax=Dinothrombium tinctorium TaxID=1965070 RepID=A0A3S3NQB5_9ACAR|nr:alpha-ketoglutarate-dependent dioxygenase alkB 4-like protein [Dinothrombium tinctorium]RWS03990.1 alpha-ketoglutarate-dependent dioxygenase alkB 4-like protein [Dinothrombium tinctorium]RWS04050.1 alpha-ketoglutarate-dependent dioxygenase alkB 4-like protein [Dinothrombium tinctorium]